MKQTKEHENRPCFYEPQWRETGARIRPKFPSRLE
jgi:hypothetical protein